MTIDTLARRRLALLAQREDIDAEIKNIDAQLIDAGGVAAMSGHRLLPIGTRPLHQTEAFLVARTTARGIWAGQCSCGLLVFGANEVDRFVIWREHRDAAHAVANGRDG